MKLVIGLLASLLVVGCGATERVTVFHNNDRVTELERRADLNDQLDLIQTQHLEELRNLLALETEARQEADLQLSDELQAEMDARIATDDELRDLLAQEEAARVAGDDTLRADLQTEIANRIAGDIANSHALGAAVFLQSLTNLAVQVQLNSLNNKINLANSKISSLTIRVNNLEEDVDGLQSEVTQLALDLANVNSSLQAQIDDLATQQAATQAQLDREGVKLFKCNSPSSTERIMKINGKFYAVMNRVMTQSVKVVTGTSSQTFTTPDLCQTFGGDLQLPNSGGQCTPNSGPFKSTKIPGTVVTVPSNSTGNVTVVTSVKIALDILTDGGYAVTDAGSCSFSISGNGTIANNLILVQ